MNFKVFTALFVGFLAVNVSHQSPTLKEDDLIIVVVEVLEKVLNASTNLLNQANELVDSIEKDQDGIKDKIVEYAVAIGKQLNQDILKYIDELRDGATDDGKAVIDCIDAEQGKTEAAFTKVFGDIGTCAAGETPKVLTEIRVILKQLGDLIDDLQAQTDTLSSCPDGELICLVGLATTLIETVKKVPSVAIGDINDIIALIKTIVGDVSGCANDIVTEVKADVQDIFNEAVVCIKK